MLAFKGDRGKLEDENVRGRRDLRPRTCLARCALSEGGAQPRDRSAPAFPCSWGSVAVCIGSAVCVVWGWFFLVSGFLGFCLLALFLLLNALAARSGLC